MIDGGRVISPDLEDVASVEEKTFHLTTACGGASPQGEAYPRPAGNGSAKEEADSVDNFSETEIISADEAEIINDYPDLSSDVDIDLKHQKFIDFYLTCGNKAKAAKLAGIGSDNENSRRVQAVRVFNRPEVQLYLKLKKAQMAKKAEITQEAYMSELVSIATVDIADVMETHLVRHTIENEPVYKVTFKDIADIPEYARKAIKQIKQNKDGSTELIFYDKLQALKLLGQIKGYLASDGGVDDGDETGIALIPEVNIDEE